MTTLVNIIFSILQNAFELLLDMAPYLMFGFLVAGILNEFISAEKIAKNLGKNNFSSVLKAALFGIPLPLCSCGVIPPTMSLKKAGASRGSVISFLVATPTSGADSILATYSLMGPFFAAYRVAASFLAGLFSGVFANLTSKNDPVSEQTNTPIKDAQERVNIWQRIRRVFHYAYFELLSEIGKWLVIGILIGGLITFVIPDNFFSETLTAGWQTILLMILVSIPIYVCATGSIPIAAALMLKGLNPGAAFVFLLAGPATNSVTITVVSRFLGRKTTIIYLATLTIISVTLAFGLDALWGAFNIQFSMAEHIHKSLLPGWLVWSSAIALAVLLTVTLIQNKIKTSTPEQSDEVSDMKTTFRVPDMSCNHCVNTIKDAIKNVKGVENYSVNLSNKFVTVNYNKDVTKEEIVHAVIESGYQVDES